MAASQTDGSTDEESTDEQAIDAVLEPHAEALARPLWANEDYSIDDADTWDPIEGSAVFHLAEIGTSGYVHGSISVPGATAGVEPEDLIETIVNVDYNGDGVMLDIEAEGEEKKMGLFAEMTPGQAVDLAAALCQAAIELDRRGRKRDAQ